MLPAEQKKVEGCLVPVSMKDETNKEDDEEVVDVPEHLEVAAPDDLHRGGDDQDERQSDDDPGEAGDGCEGKFNGFLLWILRVKGTH